MKKNFFKFWRFSYFFTQNDPPRQEAPSAGTALWEAAMRRLGRPSEGG